LELSILLFVFLWVLPQDGCLAETCSCLYLWRIYVVFHELYAGFYLRSL